MSTPAGPLLFADLFFGLRHKGLKIGLAEWLSLMEALRAGVVQHTLDDFYYVARALLVKSEAHFDTFDVVFASVFGGPTLSKESVEALMDWLEQPILPELTAERLAMLEKIPLEKLRKMFEERIKEQKERHDGGNRWIGTGGTSAFGHGGSHPSGVRVGGAGGGRSAVQVATARNFKKFRHDQVLDTRSISVALKKLRRLTRRHTNLELDVDESIDQTCRNAGDLTLCFTPPRKNEARVLLLMDTGGSMDPYSHLVERLFSAAHGLQHWKRFEAFSFHNCVYEELEPGREDHPDDSSILTADLLKERPKETYLIMVGDAYMAPTELLDAWGAIHYYHHNRTPGVVWLHRLRRQFTRAIWLNPIPERAWNGWTIKIIKDIFPMFPLTLEGIEQGIDELVKGTASPLAPLSELHPELKAFEFDQD